MSDSSRADDFSEEIAALRLKTSGDRDRLWQWVGAALMVLGVGLAFGAYISANSQDSGDVVIDNLEHNELIMLAVAGLSVSVVGAAVFLRYSMARFLRFWLLRQIHENRQRPD